MKKTISGFRGLWHIYEMDFWDEDYFNMEVQAYIRIDGNAGEFQFGLVTGDIDGKTVKHREEERFEFTWEGSEECDFASGSGWIVASGKDEEEGDREADTVEDEGQAG